MPWHAPLLLHAPVGSISSQTRMGPHAIPCYFHLESSCLDLDLNTVLDQLNYPNTCIIIIIINRRSGNTSHTSHGHKTGTRSMQPVRSVPLGGPVVS